MTAIGFDLSLREPRVRGLLWPAWRQHRTALLAAAGIVGALAVFLFVTGRSMHAMATRFDVAACNTSKTVACQQSLQLFFHHWDGWVRFLPRVLMFLPAVLGMFLGAPLVAREYESGTFRFAWTQGVSRGRWLLVRLALLSVVLVCLMSVLAVLFAWWYGPYERFNGRMLPGEVYEVVGPVFVARGMFALLLGVLVGALLRRPVTAMAVTAALWLAVAWPSTVLLRQHIQAPVVISQESPLNNDATWTIGHWIQDPSGHHLTDAELQRIFESVVPPPPNGGPGVKVLIGKDPLQAYFAAHHDVALTSIEPAGRFWHFQLVEGAAYLVLALGLGAGAVQVVRRRG